MLGQRTISTVCRLKNHVQWSVEPDYELSV